MVGQVQTKSRLAEEDLGGQKKNIGMKQQCTLAAQNASLKLGCIKSGQQVKEMILLFPTLVSPS